MRHNVSAGEPADNRDWTPDFRRVTPKGPAVLDATLAILSSLGQTAASRPNGTTLKKTASHIGSISGRPEPPFEATGSGPDPVAQAEGPAGPCPVSGSATGGSIAAVSLPPFARGRAPVAPVRWRHRLVQRATDRSRVPGG